HEQNAARVPHRETEKLHRVLCRMKLAASSATWATQLSGRLQDEGAEHRDTCSTAPCHVQHSTVARAAQLPPAQTHLMHSAEHTGDAKLQVIIKRFSCWRHAERQLPERADDARLI
ncbi:hypothetical protein KUCAC02_034357, partial [Chaenocephalus aceratus]